MPDLAPESTAKASDISETRHLARILEILEGLAALALVAGALIAYFQWRTATSTAEHTTLTTRPWIRVNAMLNDATGLVTVAYRNDGHSPTDIMPDLFAQFFEQHLTPEQAEKRLTFTHELSTEWPTGLDTRLVGADSGYVDVKWVPRQYFGPEEIEDLNGKNTYKLAMRSLRHLLIKSFTYGVPSSISMAQDSNI